MSRLLLAGMAIVCSLQAAPGRAEISGWSEMAAPQGTAGLGAAIRSQRSPYEGVRARSDLLPLYLYEGDRLYLHGTRVGLKLLDMPAHRFSVMLDRRFEGFPTDEVPAALAGMRNREDSVDAGLSYRFDASWGRLRAELLHDALEVSHGEELRLGYELDWQRGALHLRPALVLALRSADLNDYYYGVRREEASAQRPEYHPGGGIDVWIGVHGSYRLSEGWRVLGSLGLLVPARSVRDSPIVKDEVEPTALLGAAYDFGRRAPEGTDGPPFYLRLLYGQSSSCQLGRIVTLRCASLDSTERTGIAALEIGFPFVERVNAWPLDFVGYVGVLRHDERGLQSDFWQLNAYMKAYFHGFPWSSRLKTRLGLGAGLSLAQKVPYAERRKQDPGEDNTSKLLNYLDPSIDIDVGPLLRSRREIYLGVGVSHRSGIFGTARLLGNVSGGSNYIYTYVELRM